MTHLRFSLLSDGSSDRVLVPLLRWLLAEHLPRTAIEGHWCDLRHLRQPPISLEGRIRASVELYPCDILFIHRDAQAAPAATRREEIENGVYRSGYANAWLSVEPVRMTEAWFLFDETAIRKAAGNPGGEEPLGLPRLDQVEQSADPKSVLRKALITASGLSGRRRQAFSPEKAFHRVSEMIPDFSPLRALPAFRTFEAELAEWRRGLEPL